jgi:UMF1 family MFS transporter
MPIGQVWLTKRSLAWAGYDVASSAYVGVAPAVLSPLYFSGLLSGEADPTAAWGTLAAIGILASGIAALLTASLALRVQRFRLLQLLSAGMILAIATLAWNPFSSLLLAALAMIAAQCFYFAASTVYESFLPELQPQSLRQKLSGFSWAIGYIGGVLGIVTLLWFIAGGPETTALLQACYGVLALICAILFVVVFAMMRRAGFATLERPAAAPQLFGILSVFREWRIHRSVFRLLAGTMLVQTAISVVVTFTAPILADSYGQTLEDLLWLLLIIHLLSVPSTLAWNHALTTWSRLVPVCLLLASWAGVLLLLAFGSGTWMPLITVSAIGCCIGATSSTMRGFLAEVVPEGRSPAFFGLSTLVGRLAAAAGPALFAVVSQLEGRTAALTVTLVLMVIGAGLIIRHLMLNHPAQAREAFE